MTRLAGRVLEALIGIAVLYLANRWLDPVPLAAATAWAAGLLLVWFNRAPPLRPAATGLVAGALLGAAIHYYVHWSGRSTAPAEGLSAHLLTDAAIGLAIGALALAAAMTPRMLTGKS